VSAVSPPPDVLGAIVASSRRIVETRGMTMPMRALERRAARAAPDAGAFIGALARPGHVNVIAECKRRSPSKGVLRGEYDPVAIARSYEAAGAAAISVLTEPAFFDGSLEHLAGVRAAVGVPLLRKDFVVDEYQVVEARAHGASAVLLIVAALDAGTLRALLDAASRYELAALVEVHDEGELDRALSAGARLLGVNNRNLRTLQVSTEAAHALASAIPADCVAVAESGLRAGSDLRDLRAAGFDAFLIGERLMSAPDPGAALRGLLDEAGAALSEVRTRGAIRSDGRRGGGA
jgi:indole-3-glycerol phosphate synthase